VRRAESDDRLDLRASRDAVQVSDYKTGAEPKNADQIVFQRGAELQRVIYAAAARRLLPDVGRVVARLVFLGGDPRPRAYRLADVDAAIAEIGSHLTAACTLLEQGLTLPGPDAQEPWNDFRLALPAGLGSYLELKRQAFSQGLAGLSRVWSSR
jgi:RecB family exonuclease